MVLVENSLSAFGGGAPVPVSALRLTATQIDLNHVRFRAPHDLHEWPTLGLPSRSAISRILIVRPPVSRSAGHPEPASSTACCRSGHLPLGRSWSYRPISAHT